MCKSRVKLFRADGTELTYGWDGEFYKGSYGREIQKFRTDDLAC